MQIKLPLKNRGYISALHEIHKIMVREEIKRDFEEYLELTDGVQIAAAILVLASVIQHIEGVKKE
jgi:ADP-dependent phosphofructokinase/glucokinase